MVRIQVRKYKIHLSQGSRYCLGLSLMEGAVPSGWFGKLVRKEAEKDALALSERIGQLVGVVIGLVVAWYFLELYQSGSDFFMSDFDDLDAALFFGIAFLGVVPGLMKAILGRKNVTRPLDVALSVAILFASAWFISTFPFDFAYVSEGLSESWQFLLDWIDDEVARFLMGLSIAINLVLIPYTIALFYGVRGILRARRV